MPILFISNIVPDKPPYNGEGFTRSGNNVLLGIAEALPTDATLISCRPIVSFPKGPLWINAEDIELANGKKVHILPTLNVKIIKNIFWGWKIKKHIKQWANIDSDTKRNVLMYNLYTPPVKDVYNACRKHGCRLFAILYDLGVPPKRLGLSRLTMAGYRHMERQAEKYIPKLDGRIIINEAISAHYAPNQDFLLVDGGINSNVIERLFPLQENNTDKFRFLLAGMLWDQNGTKLLLNCIKEHPEINAEFIFAGQGIDVPLIEKASQVNFRIRYAGMLSQDALFKLYEQVDVLLNLRLEEETDFHFPSKLLEYMATGKHVLSTPVAHAERVYGEYISILKDPTPDGLAEAIKTVISMGKQNIYCKGKTAREFMLNNRTWGFQTKRILAYMTK